MRKQVLLGAMVERREKADAKKSAMAKAESMKKGAAKGSKAKAVQSEKKKDNQSLWW